MEMGTGKTKVMVDLIKEVTDVTLVVLFCPFSTIDNLKKELVKWDLQINYKIVGYETLSSSKTVYLDLLAEVVGQTTFIVCDESIFIKNSRSNRFQRVLEVSKNSKYRLILNGTPIVKNEWDLFNQMYFLSPDIIGMTEQEFRSNFFDEIIYKKRGEKEKVFYKFNDKNKEYLSELVEPYVYRYMLEFDKKINNEYIHTHASSKDIGTYDQIKQFYLEQIKNDFNSNIIMQMIGALQQHSANDTNKNKEISEYIVGKQCIVFCSYKEELEQIRALTDCYVITGDIKKEDRQKIMEEFREGNKPLLLTFGVGAYGLNLQFCNEIVYSSLTFNYGQMEQSLARIKRIGQAEDIKYTYFKTEYKVYELLEENIGKKETLANLIKKNIKNIKNIKELV